MNLSPSLEELLQDSSVEDIILRSTDFYAYRKGQWMGPHSNPHCKEQARELLTQVAEQAGLQLSLTQPSADAYLNLEPYGIFRAHAVISPMSVYSFEITLRRLPKLKSFSLESFGIPTQLKDFLIASVRDGKSILIAGATGSGKTSFISALFSLFEPSSRVLILEDSPELPLPTLASSKLLARNNRYGHRLGAQWSLEDLVYESLRMRPDRIILGECRGTEARAVAQALKTGHQGVMTTIHAGSSLNALMRFAELCGDENKNAPGTLQSHYLQAPWDLVIQMSPPTKEQKSIQELVCPKQFKTWNFSSSKFVPVTLT